MTDAISGPAHIAGPQITSRLNGSPVGQFPQVSATSHGYKAGAPADTQRHRITIAACITTKLQHTPNGNQKV
jgi:hypothetical protein